MVSLHKGSCLVTGFNITPQSVLLSESMVISAISDFESLKMSSQHVKGSVASSTLSSKFIDDATLSKSLDLNVNDPTPRRLLLK